MNSLPYASAILNQILTLKLVINTCFQRNLNCGKWLLIHRELIRKKMIISVHNIKVFYGAIASIILDIYIGELVYMS